MGRDAVFSITLVATLVWASSALGGNVEDAAKLFGDRKYAEAVELLKEELEKHPTNAQAYLFLASSYEKLSQWAEAAEAWEKFVKLAKSDGEKTFGETRLKACRARAAGKEPVPPKKPTPPKPTGFEKYEKQSMVFTTIRTEHFMVQAKNRTLCEDAAKEAERHLGRIRSVFLEGREWPHVVTICIHKNHGEYVLEAGTPEWSGGGYSVRSYGTGETIRRVELFALDGKRKYIQDLLTKTLPHELTHVVLHEYFGERTFRGLPLALNEGLAMYVEEGTAVRYEKQLAEAVKKGHYYKLPDLFKMQRYPPSVGLFYAQSASATRYLIEKGMTAEQFQTFLAQIKKGNDMNAALQTALGRPGDLLAAMETHWVDMLKEKAVEYAKKPTPKKKPPEKKPAPTPPTVTKEKPETVEQEEEDEEDVIIKVE